MVSNTRMQTPDYCDAITAHLLNKMWHGNSKPYPKMNKVRRNLFGFNRRNSENHLLDKRITDMAEKSSQEWNFDFLNEIPQDGRFVWQRVRCFDVPVWYATANLTAVEGSCCSSKDFESGEKQNASQCGDEESKISEEEKSKSCKKPRLVQTSMKDYTRVQKRRSSRRLRLKQLSERRLQKRISSSVFQL